MKKILSLVLVGLCFTSCFNKGIKASKNDEITVVSREAGSGTRGAFVELFGVEQKNSQGKKVDMTVETADITNSTEVCITTVKGNVSAIGYISLGSLNDSVKALQIDGVSATVENIKSGEYKVSRPFNIITKGELSNVSEDFIDYILSSDGQAIIEKKGYISSTEGKKYNSKNITGTVRVAGSSSVYPVMEKLSEEYKKLNPQVVIEVYQSDSTTGVNSTVQGICDIGMASRALKSSEKDKGVTSTVIAIDGIAVIVNKDNTISSLTKEEVKQIYTGNIKMWSTLAGNK